MVPRSNHCGTKEMVPPCPIHLQVISSVAHLKRWCKPFPIHLQVISLVGLSRTRFTPGATLIRRSSQLVALFRST